MGGVGVAVWSVLEELAESPSARSRLMGQHVRVETNQPSIMIGVTVARSGPAGLDVAQDRAGVTAYGVVITHEGLRGYARPEWRHESDQGVRGLCACERRWRRESR